MNDLKFIQGKFEKDLKIIFIEDFRKVFARVDGLTQLLQVGSLTNEERDKISQLLLDSLPKINQHIKLFYEKLINFREFLNTFNTQKSHNSLIINLLQDYETPPWDLLLLADPHRTKVETYLQNGKTYLAWLDEAVVGVYVLLPFNETEIELINIAIAEKYQGQGLGKQLIMSAIQTVKNLQFQKMRVGTGNSSLSQLALYQKCGFQLVGIDKGFFLKNYPEPIFENGIQCVDMIRLEIDL